jgi:hypothetical protein
MPKLVVVNPWHWLNADGSFPSEPRLRKQSIRVAQYIEYGGPLGLGEVRETLVSCRARGCPGLMMVLKQRDEAIQAFCQVCAADEFLIYEWEKTPWAQGHRPGKKVTEIAESHGIPLKPPREPTVGDLPGMLERTLRLMGSPLPAAEVLRLITITDHPGVVLQAVVASVVGPPPTQGATERFAAVLMNLWNGVPRDDLGGRTPSDVFHDGPAAREASRPLDLGRNRPCPCGSGKKFKRCCIAKQAN